MSPREQAFIELYEAHHDEVHAFCVRRVGWDRVDDVVSEVFVVVWRRIEEVGPDTGRAWLFAIARGVILNQWRSTKRSRRLVEKVGGHRPAAPAGPEAVVVRRSEDAVVVEALETLRPDDAEILRLSAWEELSGPEIAIALGVSTAAAQKRLLRAKKRLARVLGGRTDTGTAAEGAQA